MHLERKVETHLVALHVSHVLCDFTLGADPELVRGICDETLVVTVRCQLGRLRFDENTHLILMTPPL